MSFEKLPSFRLKKDTMERKDHEINLIPKLQRDQKIAFVITSDFYDDNFYKLLLKCVNFS